MDAPSLRGLFPAIPWLSLSRDTDERPAGSLERAARDGDRDSFAALVTRHQADVYALCARILGPGDDARDAAQEAFVRAYFALSRYDASQPFIAWVLRIARNH